MLPRVFLCILWISMCAVVAVTTSSTPTTTTIDGAIRINSPANITSNDVFSSSGATSDDEAKQLKLARKALRRKKKRLRKLREKVRLLRAELFLENGAVDHLPLEEGGNNASSSTLTSTISPPKKQNQKLGGRNRNGDPDTRKGNLRWRKRIMKQLAQVIRRLDRLESMNDDQQRAVVDQSSGKTSQKPGKQEKMSKKDRREERRRRRKQQRLRKLIDKVDGKAVSTPSGKKKDRLPIDSAVLLGPSNKLDKLHSSINQSLSGDQGGPCIGHKDCKPGLCCHSSTTNNGTVKFCVLHGFLNGAQCDDSCQCSAGLHCFKVANEPTPVDLQLPQSFVEQQSRGARCKKATAEDLLHGVYLNAKDAAFNTLPYA